MPLPIPKRATTTTSRKDGSFLIARSPFWQPMTRIICHRWTFLWPCAKDRVMAKRMSKLSIVRSYLSRHLRCLRSNAPTRTSHPCIRRYHLENAHVFWKYCPETGWKYSVCCMWSTFPALSVNSMKRCHMDPADANSAHRIITLPILQRMHHHFLSHVTVMSPNIH